MKIRPVLTGVCLISLLANIGAGAVDAQQVPNNIGRSAVIEYDENCQPVIISQGPRAKAANSQVIMKHPTLTPEQLLELERENEFVEQIHRETADVEPIEIPLPEIEPGMRVRYDGTGTLREILVLDDEGNYVDWDPPTVLTRANTQTVYTYGTTEAGTENQLTVTKDSAGKVVQVLGEGDFTVFTDTIGNHDNTLVKGDCATKYKYDNPKNGQEIEARNLDNDVKSYFIKNDIGSMPNAVLDIWKTGVTKLGIDSTNYDNIKFAGRYFYHV